MMDVIMSVSSEIERYVSEYGEHRRGLIINALEFLDMNEALWDLDAPIDRSKYIENLLSHTAGGY